MITMSCTIHNIYPDGTVIADLHDQVVTAPADHSNDALQEWAEDHLFNYTGTGRDDSDASYIVTITKCSDTTLIGHTVEFL